MSDLLRIMAVYTGLFVAPPLGVVAHRTASRTGRWPWEYGIDPSHAQRAMTATASRWREYLAGWRADYRDGEIPHRIAAFIVSFGLLYRAGIHSIVAVLSYPGHPDFDVDHGLTWTPIAMDRVPLWTARFLTVGSGLTLAYKTGWPVWGWSVWVQWLARLYLFAQVGVWCAEPIAILRDYTNGN